MTKYKDWLTTGLGAAILVAVVILFVTLQNQSPQAAAPLETKPANVAAADDMASMHGGAAVDTGTFNSLTGEMAPDFTLSSYNGDQITLNRLRGQNVILFFNEGLMCYPACWDQIAAFGKDTQSFKNKNTVVLNITVDPKDQWKDALVKMPELASATVLFDTNRQISSLYGVLTTQSSMHRGQFPGHSYVVIDKNGIVRFTHDDPNMAVHNHELLNEISQL